MCLAGWTDRRHSHLTQRQIRWGSPVLRGGVVVAVGEEDGEDAPVVLHDKEDLRVGQRHIKKIKVGRRR
jgi:hypothetical protein